MQDLKGAANKHIGRQFYLSEGLLLTGAVLCVVIALLFAIVSSASACDGKSSCYLIDVPVERVSALSGLNSSGFGQPLPLADLENTSGGVGVTPYAPSGGPKAAVILWDEFKKPAPPSRPGKKGSGSASVRITVLKD